MNSRNRRSDWFRRFLDFDIAWVSTFSLDSIRFDARRCSRIFRPLSSSEPLWNLFSLTLSLKNDRKISESLLTSLSFHSSTSNTTFASTYGSTRAR